MCFSAARTHSLPTTTGVAPFRAFLQHRQFELQRQPDLKKTAASAVLFYGCRFQQLDFIYGEEIFQMLKTGVLTELITSFSREQPQKIYVQHRLKDHARHIYELIVHHQANIFVCG